MCRRFGRWKSLMPSSKRTAGAILRVTNSLEYAQQLSALSIRVDQETPGRAFGHILALAERYQMTTYDASYLELAQRRGISIATTDGNLIQAASAVRVPIQQP
jgi:predicted nucleic acid-binding protein